MGVVVCDVVACGALVCGVVVCGVVASGVVVCGVVAGSDSLKTSDTSALVLTLSRFKGYNPLA